MSTTTFNGTLYLGTVSVDMSRADISGHYETFDVSAAPVGTAHAQITSSATVDLDGVFWFKTDSMDVSNNDITDKTDLRFAYNNTQLQLAIKEAIDNLGKIEDQLVKVYGEEDDGINIGRCDSINQTSSHGYDGSTDTYDSNFGNLGTLTIGISGAHYGAMPANGGTLNLSKDIARFMAFKLTGGYASTDIFSNERDLDEAIITALNHETDGVLNRIQNNLIDANGVVHHDKFNASEWGNSGAKRAPTGTEAVAGSGIDSSMNLTEAVINYLRGTKDLGQYLVNQAVYAYDNINWGPGGAVGEYGINKSIADASGDTVGLLDWCPITVDDSKPITIAIKLVFNNIGGTSHNGSVTPGNGGLAGGNNIIGSRSYMITMSDSGVNIPETGVGDDPGGDNVA